MICVLAGNYGSIDDAIAQDTLNKVKKFHPKFLRNTKNGAVTRNSGPKGPLAGAFMTINPLRKPEEIRPCFASWGRSSSWHRRL